MWRADKLYTDFWPRGGLASPVDIQGSTVYCRGFLMGEKADKKIVIVIQTVVSCKGSYLLKGMFIA